ncbi:beta family protein [Photobacterium galatheae]|uniref:Beta protein n=1 Tax=Photobacterium galatheae TaxID=1654360 RepID=A0A066RKW4_9GAMM|nr:beta family protein [Photobacterium galatheae]KDM89726.1 hypothetical protein EA58_21200 [Photobacterium galatheae]MCM0151522.1 beta family protein [Photobacterium galatheae]
MNEHRYYPILKWKQGEHHALRELPKEIQAAISPIIDYPDMDWDFENNCYKKNLTQHLTNFGTNLKKAWKVESPVYLDVNKLDKHATDDSVHPLDTCIELANSEGRKIIPVYSPLYSEKYSDAVQRNTELGACLRIKAQALVDNEVDLNSLAESFWLEQDEVDILIDLGNIDDETWSYEVAISAFRNLASQGDAWRTVIIAASSYPETQAGIPNDQLYEVPRLEWNIWQKVYSEHEFRIQPSFGDYSIGVETEDVNGSDQPDPRKMNAAASIRYSTDHNWLFSKGRSARDYGWDQTKELCQRLVAATGKYKGKDFSWGDKYIYLRAEGDISSGNATTWRKVGNNHHITLVVDQLSKLS